MLTGTGFCNGEVKMPYHDKKIHECKLLLHGANAPKSCKMLICKVVSDSLLTFILET